MTFKKINKLHSNIELVLAITNNYCRKHKETPDICGATKEARALLGDVLKISGSALVLISFIKMLK